MKKESVIKELEEKYPGKNIILNDEENPTEIVVEVDHPNGLAVAVIDKSVAHYHKHTTEKYLVLRGELTLNLDGVTII